MKRANGFIQWPRSWVVTQWGAWRAVRCGHVTFDDCYCWHTAEVYGVAWTLRGLLGLLFLVWLRNVMGLSFLLGMLWWATGCAVMEVGAIPTLTPQG